MASSILVADYGSSDSENEEENSPEKPELEEKGSSVQAGVNLLASTEDKSDSDADSDDANGSKRNNKSSKQTDVDQRESEKLPLPSVLGIDSNEQYGVSGSSSHAPSSIFANPFEEAEQHKLSILEQHVKLTSAQRKEAELGGKKKICWKFRNGRCRFGHKCKFAHDSDVPSAMVAEDRTGCHDNIAGGVNQGVWSEQGDGDGEDEGQLMKRKKRPGLSQTLVPSKKVMTNFTRQRNQENPWSQQR